MCGSNCLGSQTQNSVPEDGFNETTHHVLLHGLSPLPLPNRVHTLSSHTVDHVQHHSALVENGSNVKHISAGLILSRH